MNSEFLGFFIVNMDPDMPTQIVSQFLHRLLSSKHPYLLKRGAISCTMGLMVTYKYPSPDSYVFSFVCPNCHLVARHLISSYHAPRRPFKSGRFK